MREYVSHYEVYFKDQDVWRFSFNEINTKLIRSYDDALNKLDMIHGSLGYKRHWFIAEVTDQSTLDTFIYDGEMSAVHKITESIVFIEKIATPMQLVKKLSS